MESRSSQTFQGMVLLGNPVETLQPEGGPMSLPLKGLHGEQLQGHSRAVRWHLKGH
jgi:hypothetical protein